MKLKSILTGTLIFLSFYTFSQTLYVPSGTSGIGTSSNSNIGIGSSSPCAKLDVNGSIYTPFNNSYWIGSTTSSGNRLRLHHNGNIAVIDYVPSLYFRSGTNTMFVMTQEGYLQIGNYNATPKGKLTIFSNNDPSNNEFDNQAFMIWSGVTGSTDYVLIAGVSKTSKCSYIQSVNVNITPTTLALNYRGGLVAIGTVDFTKTTGYSLAVAGGILAEKVVVKLRANWPDYVFDENYKLPKLNEVESFIKENNHLPETPTATEIANEGIDLATMNSILLKKIEELTLYTIELNKRIVAIEKENQGN